MNVRPLVEKRPIFAEDLDPIVAAVGNVDTVLCIDGDIVNQIKLPRAIAFSTPFREVFSTFIKFHDTGVVVAIRHIGLWCK